MRLFISLLLFSAYCLFTTTGFAEDPVGTSNSRPNVGSGHDYYDSDGNKTGSSEEKADGGYNYYDKYGNLVGSLDVDSETGEQTYVDGENVERGSLESDPYGGYRFEQQGEDTTTATQSQVRGNYEYASPYGDGLETLSPDVIQGRDAEDSAEPTSESGLAETSSTSSGLSLPEEATAPATPIAFPAADETASDASDSDTFETSTLETGLETDSGGSGLSTSSQAGSGLATP